MGTQVTFLRPDRQERSGYYVEPQGGQSAPGMVVIHEWWGLNDQIKGVAERLRTAGYRVLVPDLYRGTMATEAMEAEHLMSGLDFQDAASEDIRGAVQYLKGTSARAGITGFCMGGALTILSAVSIPEADAAVCWYGYPPPAGVQAAKIKIPIMGHFATRDAFFPVSGVTALEEKFKAAGVTYQFHMYEATHAFANEMHVHSDLPLEYNQEAALLAWVRTMDFLGHHLKQYWT